MKKTSFLFVALTVLLMMGCSKDELINDNGENSQSLKSGRGDGGTNGWNFTEFYGTSRIVEDSILIICRDDMNCGRKLQKLGNFSGNLPGYGKINPSLSSYTINFLDKDNPSEYFTLYGDSAYYALYNNKSYTDRIEPYFYNIVICGIVATSTKDSFRLTITGKLSPLVPLLDINTGNISCSRFIADDIVITEGKGKFKNYTQIFYNCGTTQISGTNFSGANLEGTGEMSIYVNNIHF